LEAHAFLTVAGNEDFLNKYLSGTVKAVSATVGYDTLICGICGHEWLSDACIKAADDAGQKIHWPGDTFDGKLCILTFTIDTTDTKALLEVSPVYCGASKGRLKFAAKNDKHETIEQARAMREKFVKNAFKLSFDLADEAPPEQPADEIADLKAEIAGLKANLDAARENYASLEKDHAHALEMTRRERDEALQDAENIRAELAAAQAALDAEKALHQTSIAAAAAAAEKAAAEIADLHARADAFDASLDEIVSPFRDDVEKMSIADKTNLVAALAALAAGLRTWAASRVEKLRVQLDGNRAVFPSDVTTSTSATDIVNILDAAERAVCDRFGVEPITGVVPPVSEPKRLDTSSRVFKIN
ncbi:MAG TPA: hypothetical protein PLE35_12075, partial [Lentisphaeria bacterium]|nr:hypothetical protein [Lentisphaeria bacterium]